MRTLLFRGAPVRFPLPIALIITAAIGGCAVKPPIVSESLPHDTFRLKCKTTLPRCLDRAEDICHGNRYTVLRAVDVHDYAGSEGSVGESEFRSSEALFRCGTRGTVLWGPGADPMADAPAPAPPGRSPPVDARAGGGSPAALSSVPLPPTVPGPPEVGGGPNPNASPGMMPPPSPTKR